MKNSLLQLTFGLVVLIVGAGLEEMLPKFLGVGFPILLTAVQFMSLGPFASVAIVFAALAGATEDALSSLPLMTSVSYFLVVALLVRRLGLPRGVSVFAYPCYQLWLAVWSSGLGGGIFNRLLLSFPLGVVTSVAVGVLVCGARRGAAIDEQD